MPTRVGLTLAVTFVDLISLLDISSAAPGVAGGQSITPGLFDDKLQDGLALAGALAVAGTATPPLVTSSDLTLPPASAMPTAPVVPAPIIDTETVPTETVPTETVPTETVPTDAAAPTPTATTGPAAGLTSNLTTNLTTALASPVPPTAADTTAPVAPSGSPATAVATPAPIAVSTSAALAATTDQATTDPTATDGATTGTAATAAVPLDAVRADSSLARRLLGGLRHGRDGARAGRDPMGEFAPQAHDGAVAPTDVAAPGSAANEPTTGESTTADSAITNDSAAPDATSTGTHAPTHEPRSASTGTATSTTSSPDGATGTGLFHTDKVRYLRDLAPAREIQRLAVDLDDARVAVRFGGGATTVDVVSDPSSRLDAGWVSSVEKSLRQMDSPTAPPSSGSRDGSDTRNGGQDRSMQDERRRRALEDATQRRWHDAAMTSGED